MGDQHMDLDRYLERIGYRGSTSMAVSRATLDQLMTTHVNAVTFENLNQQLGRPVTMCLKSTFEKVVEERRGGWCFELNSLFAWSLDQLGFKVQILPALVGRQDGQPFEADHMLLRVDLDQPYLVDVGFGGGLVRSVPLQQSADVQPPYSVSVRALADGYVRYSEDDAGKSATYDFSLKPVDVNHFETACHRLQSDPDSPFRRTLTAQRRSGDQHLVLRGLVLRRIGPAATEEVVFASKKQLVTCLKQDFGLDVPEIGTIWPDLVRRHEDLFGPI